LIKLRNDLSETVGTRVAHSKNSDDDDVLYDDDIVYIVTVKLPVEPAVFQLSPALSSLPYADTYTVTIHASQLMQRASNYQASASLGTSADALICHAAILHQLAQCPFYLNPRIRYIINYIQAAGRQD